MVEFKIAGNELRSQMEFAVKKVNDRLPQAARILQVDKVSKVAEVAKTFG